MGKIHKILLLDCNTDRRLQITASLQGNMNCRIDSRSHIGKNAFEHGCYHVVFVHSNNTEGAPIENEEWDAGAAKVVLFSGGYGKDRVEYDGFHYVKASYIENQDNLCQLLMEMLNS